MPEDNCDIVRIATLQAEFNALEDGYRNKIDTLQRKVRGLLGEESRIRWALSNALEATEAVENTGEQRHDLLVKLITRRLETVLQIIEEGISDPVFQKKMK